MELIKKSNLVVRCKMSTEIWINLRGPALDSVLSHHPFWTIEFKQNRGIDLPVMCGTKSLNPGDI